MGRHSFAKKQPKFAPGNSPAGHKQPRAADASKLAGRPVWRVSHIDWGGPWCPSAGSALAIRKLLERLGNFESMTWPEIKAPGDSHFIEPEDIVRPARQRLTALKRDDWADQLFSLRISGKERLWGFLRADVFHVLWWDPEHQVCPSAKKHT